MTLQWKRSCCVRKFICTLMLTKGYIVDKQLNLIVEMQGSGKVNVVVLV